MKEKKLNEDHYKLQNTSNKTSKLYISPHFEDEHDFISIINKAIKEEMLGDIAKDNIEKVVKNIKWPLNLVFVCSYNTDYNLN